MVRSGTRARSLQLLFILAPRKSRIARLAGRVLRVIILLRWLSSVALAALKSCARISHWQGTTIGRAADESNREPLHHPTELTWRGAGFTPADALLWDAAAFDPAGADLWRRHEFDVNDAYAWRKIIVEHASRMTKYPLPRRCARWAGRRRACGGAMMSEVTKSPGHRAAC